MVAVAGVVVGEDGKKEGMGKWILTRVRKAVVGPLCGLFAWFKTDATDQYTSFAIFSSGSALTSHSPF